MTRRRPKVFIVHGHDRRARDQLSKTLTELGADPIIFAEDPEITIGILEKFEKLAKQCDFAIILLTPDDKNSSELSGLEIYRSRQNVIFEMGYFLAALGREKTLLLYRGEVELPSDITGILYVRFSRYVSERKKEIHRALIRGRALRAPAQGGQGPTPAGPSR